MHQLCLYASGIMFLAGTWECMFLFSLMTFLLIQWIRKNTWNSWGWHWNCSGHTKCMQGWATMTSTKMELIIWVTTSQIKEYHNISDKGISVDLENIKSMIIKTCKIFCGTCRILQEVHWRIFCKKNWVYVWDKEACIWTCGSMRKWSLSVWEYIWGIPKDCR